MPIKLLLCDTADGLAQLQYALLKSSADVESEAVTDGFRAVDVAARIQPDVVVVEAGMTGLSGAELVRRLIATVPQTRVICWTSLDSPFTASEMIAAGTSGYLLKSDGPEVVVAAIRSILEGNLNISPRVAGLLAEGFADPARAYRELNTAAVQDTKRVEEDVTSAKADFLANVSHELRTPITVAKGIAYVLRNRWVSEEEREEFLDKLGDSLEKLMMIVDEMLTIAELEQGTLSLKLTEVDLAPLIRHAADEVHRHYPIIEIQRLIPERLPALADPVRISEVIRQLLDNACRYSPEDGSVSIRARTVDEGVVLSVTDGGLGMARDVVAQAFNEAFTTGEDILRKERSGIGIGLHMARRLVLQHGGVIWADPVPAGGTRVSFCLPAHRGEKILSPPTLTNEDIGPPTIDSIGPR
ncbi:MAG TPA: ATP-binding protein [Actinomycetota bacterium]|nr:ATP-binding protein [Actinomycetota bacterium]